MTIAQTTKPKRVGPLVLIIAVAAIATSIDLAVKAIASAELSNGVILDWGLVSIQLVTNTGVAFGLGSSLPTWVVMGFTGAVIAGLAAYLIARSHRMTLLSTVGGGVLLGGSLGNFVDRLDGSGVVDYLHTGWFATFNLADVFVTAGVATLLLGMLVGQRSAIRTGPGHNSDFRPSDL
ncbi:MAG: signal peptidase II [Rhodoglobus sp.]